MSVPHMVIMNEQNLLYGTQSNSNLKVRHLSDFERLTLNTFLITKNTVKIFPIYELCS